MPDGGAARDAMVARGPKGHIKAFMSGRAGRPGRQEGEGDEALTKLSRPRPDDQGHNSTETWF